MIKSQQYFDKALAELLMPADLTEQQVANLINDILGNQIDYADIYFQALKLESWTLEDGVVKEGNFTAERGVGVRAISGQKTGFAYSEDIALPALNKAAIAAKSIAKLGTNKQVCVADRVSGLALYQPFNPIESLLPEDKIKLLHEIDQIARQQDKRIGHVMASITGVYETVLIMASDGTLAADIRPLVRLNVSVVAEQKGRRERGNSGGGGRYDYK